MVWSSPRVAAKPPEWIGRYRRLRNARFDELDMVVDELKRQA
jgi:hypothetical protein